MITIITAACGGIVAGWVARSLLVSRSDALGPPPLRLDPGRIQRGNGHGGPTTPKPRMIPPGTRSITFPDATADRRPINPFTGEPAAPAWAPPAKPHFPPPRVIRDDFLPSPADTIAAIRAADAAISEQALEAELRAWWRSQGWLADLRPFAVKTHLAWARHLLSRGVGG